jgi:hypothetical protein
VNSVNNPVVQPKSFSEITADSRHNPFYQQGVSVYFTNITMLLKYAQKEDSMIISEALGNYPGFVHILSNWPKTNKMQVCLSDMALKASDNSYISETLSKFTSYNTRKKKSA